MSALLPGQVNELNGLLYRAERGFGNSRGWTDEGDDAPVVVMVRLTIQQHHFGHTQNRLNDGVYFRLIAAFRKVRDTLDELARH